MNSDKNVSNEITEILGKMNSLSILESSDKEVQELANRLKGLKVRIEPFHPQFIENEDLKASMTLLLERINVLGFAKEKIVKQGHYEEAGILRGLEKDLQLQYDKFVDSYFDGKIYKLVNKNMVCFKKV